MGPDALAAAEPVLAALRRWRPVYARWAYHPCAAPGCPPPPWSPGDEERLAALRALAPDVLARAATGWRRLAAALGHSGKLLVSLTRTEADRHGRELAARTAARADRAGARADTLDQLAERLDASLAEFTARLARLAAPLATGGYANPRTALEDIDAADRARVAEAHWPDLDELVARHATALVTLRAGLDELLELTRSAAPREEVWSIPSPEPGADSAGPPGWCTVSSGCAPAASTTPPASAPGRAEDPLREWQALPPRAAAESGPALPGTESRRVGPDVGVYLPLMPE
ncbi:hypothetical protein GCM10023321_30740 [Pseudonocardia eucalypti]|uniref:Uncharacterized protein n=1 Tax=Pseudonocardia eucalypti TaxID=648755 RepID=A0ABP9Q2R2_9PSEU|nr:hypothetical protein [Pseudonocardia eucalypti]